jgi:uncharacterized membrane protein YfcA
LTLAGLDPALLAAFAIVVFLAAVIRGYSGFGFSALTVAAMSFALPVRAVVPVVLVLEIVASVQMAPRVLGSLDRQLLLILACGSLLAIPLGQHLLLGIGEPAARVAVSGMILAVTGLVVSGVSLQRWRGTPFFATTGILAGLANGLVAMGGLVTSSLLLAANLRIETLRATMVALLFLVGGIAITSGLLNGLVDSRSLLLSALMTPPLLLGVTVGNRRFDPEKTTLYRRITLGLLASMAVAGLLRAW